MPFRQFTYKYHADYGSDEFDHEGKPGGTELPVEAATLRPDRKSVHLKIPGLQTGFVTSFRLDVASAEDEELRTDTFYYTLNARRE